jgi:hypothetical protein
MVHCDSGYVGARTYSWTERLADLVHRGVKLTRNDTEVACDLFPRPTPSTDVMWTE